MNARRSRRAFFLATPVALAIFLALASASAFAAIGHNYLCQITGTSPGSATECHSGGSALTGGLVAPDGLAFSGGNLWAADPGNAAVDEFDSSGAALFQQTGGAASFSSGGIIRVAVNDATQFSYVLDNKAGGGGGTGVVDVFDNTGAFVTQWNGSTTPSGSFGNFPNGVAVDNSSGASSGDVYVSDFAHQRVDKLDPSGNPVAFTGSASYISASQLIGTPGGAFGNLQGVAVDPAGDIFAIDANSPNNGGQAELDVYDQSGSFIGSLTGSDTPDGNLGFPSGVAFGPTDGHVYVADHGNEVVDEFDSSGAYVSQVTGDGTPTGSFSRFGANAGIQGIAVDAVGDVYVSDAGNHVVDEFGPDVPLPDTVTGHASNLTQTTAALNGTVNPDGTTLTDCHFAYVKDADYEPSMPDPDSAGATVPCASPPTGSAPVPVSADISGLEVGTLYHFRLVAGNANGTTHGQDQTFVTVGPGFGIQSFDGSLTNQDGSPATQAGSHPYQLETSLDFNTKQSKEGLVVPDQNVKDVQVDLPAGLNGDPTAVPQCTQEQLITQNPVNAGASCPGSSQVGFMTVTYNGQAGGTYFPGIFNMVPPPGEPAELAAIFGAHPVFFHAHLRSGGDYGLTADLTDIPSDAPLISSSVVLWGVPADSSHDSMRGDCLELDGTSNGSCPSGSQPRPFFTLPTSCAGPQTVTALADSWQDPGNFVTASFITHDNQGNPLGFDGCNRLQFNPAVGSEPTTSAATSATGLSFDINVDDPGLHNPGGLVQSQIKKAVVTLPQGFTTNPSVAEGLRACSQAEFEAATAEEGTGCLSESKVGEVEIQSPLIQADADGITPKVTGGIYVARQGENPNRNAQHPNGNLLTLYLIARSPELGVLVRQALKVTPSPVTGQLTTEVDNIPQLPFSKFHLEFRTGQRAPLVTPPLCGTYSVEADLYPYSEPSVPLHDTSSFTITQGPEGQPCPSGTPPFHPDLEAGTQNNAAGTYSPFYTHITRRDSEQEITNFSIKLPPGIAGILAGIPYCPDSAIAAAKSREVEGGGGVEEANPSCPGASQVGHSLVGSGVGNVLAYAPGKIYLAGPYHGSNLSLVSITAAKVGPFDLGTVVVRFALRVDPETAEVFVDSTGSDPIPHIVDGIPVHLRDIRAYVDRPNFIFNPTSCAKTSTASTVLGSGLDFVSAADDNPVTVSSPFQAADCASLAFKPKLAISLKGSTKRGGNPAFKAVVTYPYPGANIREAQVTLPNSEFLDNAHIGTVCTRVQFKEGTVLGEKCPAESVYGFAKAVTPVFSEPLEGPVYLRSTGTGAGAHVLPDLLAALHNKQVDIALAGHTEGTKAGGIRNTFEAVPDAPVTKFTLELKGAKKGLLENSKNLCAKKHYANAVFTGQNGKIFESKPVVKVSCKKHKAKKHRSASH